MKRIRTVLGICGVAVLASLADTPVQAADFPTVKAVGKYDFIVTPQRPVRMEKNVMVTMRDGVRLATNLYFPADAEGPFAVIMIRTPYGKDAYTAVPEVFAQAGFAVAVQDKRGKFSSEGTYFVGANDDVDGFDTATWLAGQDWSTGKVGTYGCSYLGENQIRLASLKHPDIAAMIPQAAGGGVGSAGGRHRYFGFRYGGVWETAAAVGWFQMAGSKVSNRAPDSDLPPPPETPPWVVGPQIWRHLPQVDQLKQTDALPNDFAETMSHPPGDPWWEQFGYLKDGDTISAPALHVNSWYDYGLADTLFAARYFADHAVNDAAADHQYILISPTTHCMTESAVAPTIVGQRNFGDATFPAFDLYFRWFDRWLNGNEQALDGVPKVQYFLMGANMWQTAEQWPPAGVHYTDWFLQSDGSANSSAGDGVLAVDRAGDETAEADAYVYDPDDPIPTHGGPACCTKHEDLEGVADQQGVELREDMLVYTSAPLTEQLDVVGPIELVLYVSSNVPDTDFTGKLVDVAPDGTAWNLQEGVIRARYREGLEKEVFMKPGEVYEVRLELQATANRFLPGHRIRLEVASSNFPRFERNLNTGGDNITETDWRVANNRVHHSAEHPSRLILPVLSSSAER